MLIVVVEQWKAPYIRGVNDTLEEMQSIVGGYIQVIYPFLDPVALVCNEEGKLTGLPLNRSLSDKNGEIYEIIAGTFFLCGAPTDSVSFTGLQPEQAERYKKRFLLPEVFLRVNGRIVALRFEEDQGPSR